MVLSPRPTEIALQVEKAERKNTSVFDGAKPIHVKNVDANNSDRELVKDLPFVVNSIFMQFIEHFLAILQFE